MEAEELKREILPRIVAVRLDETNYWCDEIKAKVKKIYGHYLFDENLVTHICSFQRNYFLRFVGYDFETDLEDSERDALDQEIFEGYHTGDDQDGYYLEQTINRIPFGGWQTEGPYKIVFLTTSECKEILDENEGDEDKMWDEVLSAFHENSAL